MILPVVYPPITSDPQYADMLTTTLPYKGGVEWYHGHFIQIYADFKHYHWYGKGELRFREELFAINRNSPVYWYDALPIMKNKSIFEDIGLFIDMKNIVDAFRTILNDGSYIIAYLDRHYINKRYPLGTIHSVLIYGYNEVAFNIADFVSDTGGYAFAMINFDDTLKSFCLDDNYQLPPFIDSAKKIVAFKMANSDYKVDTKLVKRLLEDYYLERNTTDSYECITQIERYRDKSYWGMGCISYLIDYYNDYKRGQLDIKSLYLMSDHKKAMCDRIQYFLKNKLLSNSNLHDAYSKIRDHAMACLSLGVKYLYTNDVKLITKIISQLQYIYDHEKNTMERMLMDFES